MLGSAQVSWHVGVGAQPHVTPSRLGHTNAVVLMLALHASAHSAGATAELSSQLFAIDRSRAPDSTGASAAGSAPLKRLLVTVRVRSERRLASDVGSEPIRKLLSS